MNANGNSNREVSLSGVGRNNNNNRGGNNNNQQNRHANLTCHGCGEMGHIVANCPKKQNGGNSTGGSTIAKTTNKNCNICGEKGHLMKDCPKAKKEVGGIEILVPMVEIDVGCGGGEFLCCQECNEPTVRITHCAGCGHLCENCDHCRAMEQCCNDFMRAIDLGQKPKSFGIGEERTNKKLKAENQVKIKEEEVDDHD